MIALHFNPCYDTGAWSGEPPAGSSRIGEGYVGPMGLLSALETRLGLTSPERPPHEVLSMYMNAAKGAAGQDPDIFFAKSLVLSPLTTAAELLRWRDELILAGWTAGTPVPEGLTSGAKTILGGLAEVEALLAGTVRTTADRWRALLSALEKTASLEGFSVTIHVSGKHLHPVHRTVLEHLRRCGISVTESLGDHSPEVDIKHFRDSADACLWAAACSDGALLVCSAPQTLASAMAAFGRHPLDVPASETPRPVEHLFTSAMRLLLNGGDIDAFRDYLSPPRHPLNAFKMAGRTLREALLEHVVRTHGFKGTDDLAEAFSFGDAGVLEQVRSWLPEPGGQLTYDRIKTKCRQLSDWAEGCLRAVAGGGDDPYVAQWARLSSLCREMEFQCRQLGYDAKPVIPGNKFVQVLRDVSEPTSSSYSPAAVGAASVVSSVEDIAVEVGDVIWVDPFYQGVPSPLPFLCQEDARILSVALPSVWLQEDAMMLAEDLFLSGLSRMGGRLTVLYNDTSAGKKREKHPFLLRQGRSISELEHLPYETVPAAMAEQCVVRPLITVPPDCVLTADGLVLPDHESPTTLEGMFSQPLDWVLGSVLHLREEGESNLSLIMGLVAHDVIHRICLKAADGGTPVTADAFGRAFKSDYEAFFDAAVHDTGAELGLTENSLEREMLRTNLRSAGIPRLVEIIRESGLTIIGSEVGSENVDISLPGYEPLRVTGTIDLLLKNAAGHYVIIDFKWAGASGRKERESQVKKGTDYQLALYRRLAETGSESITAGPVEAQAFYMLRTAELLTAYDGFRDGRGPVEAVGPSSRPRRMTYEETLEDIHRKYTETVAAFRKGSVPSGDLKSPYLRFKVLKGKLD